MKNYLISIYIITYNRVATITNAINSVLKQTHADFELIVVDDGSKDNTQEIVKSFNDSRIRYFYKKHGGVPESRNYAIAKAKGKWICFLDSDDEYHKDYLKEHLANLRGEDDYVVSYTDAENVLSNGVRECFSVNKFMKTQKIQEILRQPRAHIGIAFTLCCSKRILQEIGGYKEDLKVSSDVEMHIRLLAKSKKYKHIDKKLYIRYKGVNGISYNLSHQHYSNIDLRVLDTLFKIFAPREIFPGIKRIKYSQQKDFFYKEKFKIYLREYFLQCNYKYFYNNKNIKSRLIDCLQNMKKDFYYSVFSELLNNDISLKFKIGFLGRKNEHNFLTKKINMKSCVFLKTENQLKDIDILILPVENKKKVEFLKKISNIKEIIILDCYSSEQEEERQQGIKLSDIRKDHIARYKLASKHIKKHMRVLDIACGVGYGSYLINKNIEVQEIEAVDRSLDAILHAKLFFSSSKIKHIVHDALKFKVSFDVSKFDCICSFETVEHIMNDVKFLRNMHNLLKPKGLFIISTPNQDIIPFDKKLFKFHIKHYSTKDFIKLLDSAGFVIVHSYSQVFNQIYKGFGGHFNIAICMKKNEAKENIMIRRYIDLLKNINITRKSFETIFFNESKRLINLGAKKEALFLLEKGLNFKNSGVFYLLGCLNEEDNHKNRAIAYFKRATKQKINNKNIPYIVSSYLHLGLLEKNIKKRKQYLTSCLQINGLHQKARDMLDNL